MVFNYNLLVKIKGFKQIVNKILFLGEKKKISKFKNSLEGKTVIIVGNGPSLKKTPLDDFSSIPSIGMNKINLLFDNVAWRPSYLVCVNGLVIRQNRSFFKSTNIPLFLDVKAKYLGVNSKKVNYLLLSDSGYFSDNLEEYVDSGPTVTYTALQLANYMGAGKIIIFGVDHYFKDAGKAHEIVRKEIEDEDHFHPDYFSKGQLWGIPNLDESEVVYDKARKFFEAKGVKIYDATVGGHLSIFEKISIDEAKILCNI